MVRGSPSTGGGRRVIVVSSMATVYGRCDVGGNNMRLVVFIILPFKDVYSRNKLLRLAICPSFDDVAILSSKVPVNEALPSDGDKEAICLRKGAAASANKSLDSL